MIVPAYTREPSAGVGEPELQVFGDELAVEAAVFDEYLVGAAAGDYDTGEVDAGDVGLQRRGVADGAAVVGLVEADAELLQEAEVGVVSGEGEDEIVGDADAGRGGWRW